MVIDVNKASFFVTMTAFGDAIMMLTVHRNDITKGHIHIIISLPYIRWFAQGEDGLGYLGQAQKLPCTFLAQIYFKVLSLRRRWIVDKMLFTSLIWLLCPLKIFVLMQGFHIRHSAIGSNLAQETHGWGNWANLGSLLLDVLLWVLSNWRV